MARDYKSSGTRNGDSDRPLGSWLSFTTGLGIGLLVAVMVHFWHQGAGHRRAPTLKDTPTAPDTKFEEAAGPDQPNPLDQRPVIPKFDFYKILPEIEVKVPEAELAAPNPAPVTPGAGNSPPEAATYLLQVGSFQRFEDADQAKAQLALQGVSASIQRVVINGQDVWHRVHVGPYPTLGEVRATRTKLSQLGMHPIVLKLGGEH